MLKMCSKALDILWKESLVGKFSHEINIFGNISFEFYYVIKIYVSDLHLSSDQVNPNEDQANEVNDHLLKRRTSSEKCKPFLFLYLKILYSTLLRMQ